MFYRCKPYPPEFKRRTILLAARTAQPLTELARHLGIPKQTLYNWLWEARKATGESESEMSSGKKGKKIAAASVEISEAERAELKRLRKENSDLRMENEILKKAEAFFAKQKR